MTSQAREDFYCHRWNCLLLGPIKPISKRAAKEADSSGRPYMVLIGDKNTPEAIVEVNWSNKHVGTWFLDEKMRRYLKYSFTKIDDSTMFMKSVKLWEYPEETDPRQGDLSTASVVTSFSYQTNGIVRESQRDSIHGIEDIIDRSDVPLDINWEPVPTFGEWDSVARYNREPAQQGN